MERKNYLTGNDFKHKKNVIKKTKKIVNENIKKERTKKKLEAGALKKCHELSICHPIMEWIRFVRDEKRDQVLLTFT